MIFLTALGTPRVIGNGESMVTNWGVILMVPLERAASPRPCCTQVERAPNANSWTYEVYYSSVYIATRFFPLAHAIYLCNRTRAADALSQLICVRRFLLEHYYVEERPNHCFSFFVDLSMEMCLFRLVCQTRQYCRMSSMLFKWNFLLSWNIDDLLSWKIQKLNISLICILAQNSLLQNYLGEQIN